MKQSSAPHHESGPDPIYGPWIENRPSTRWLPRVDVRELWAYRELVYFLAQRDVKLRYKQTLLGVAWAVIQPLAAVVIFTIVFGRFVNVPSDGIPYAVFVYAGMVAWTFFSVGVTAAAESLVQHRGLVTHVYFPRILAPVASVLPGLLDIVIGIGVLFVLMIAYAVTPGLPLLVLPLWLLALAGATLSIGIWLAALNVLYRDVRYALGFLVQLLLFASPVVFPSSLFDGLWAYVYSLNPMVGALDGFRWSLIDAPPPGREDIASLLSGVVLLAGGLIYFHRVERRLGDRI